MSSRDMESVNSKGRSFSVKKFDTELNKIGIYVNATMNIIAKQQWAWKNIIYIYPLIKIDLDCLGR